jgi:hypothetical protein
VKEKLSVTALVLFLFLIISAETILAKSWTPGVAKGDFFCYEMYGVFTSSDLNDLIEVSAFEQNNTDEVRIDITGVSGTVVYQAYTLQFGNETTKFELKTDLDPGNAGSFNFSELGVPIFAANLNVGDTLSTVELTVEETLLRIYPSGERETNHASWNSTLDYGNCYFDKKTGMLTELNRTHLYVNPVTSRVIKKVDIIKMTNSSFWSPAEPTLSVQSSTYLARVLVAPVILCAGLSICLKKRSRPRSA